MQLTASIKEVAKMLGISKNHAYTMAQTGEIPTITLGRRVLVPLDILHRRLSDPLFLQQKV